MSVGLNSSGALKAALDYNEELKRSVSHDIVSKDVRGATTRRITATAILNNGTISGITSKISRNVDQFRLHDIRVKASSADYRKAISDTTSALRAEFDEVKAGSAPRIIETYGDLSRSITNLLSDPSSDHLKSSVVESARLFSETVSGAAKICIDTQKSTEDRLVSSLNDLNSSIAELSELNKEISAAYVIGSDNSDLLDKRDVLISEIASAFKTEMPREGHDSTISINACGIDIVSSGHFTKFIYTASDASDSEDFSLGKITAIRYDNISGREIARSDIYNPESAELHHQITEGSLKGYIDVCTKICPEYLGYLDNLALNVSEQFNKIHNNASSFAGRQTIIGKPFSVYENSSWKGSIKIGLVDEKGNAAKISDSTTPNVDMNLEAFCNLKDRRVVSASDIAAEITSLYNSPSNMSVGMCRDEDGGFGVADLKLVVNNIREGSLSLDIEALNDSIFASRVEIIDVTLPAGVNLRNEITNDFTLKSGYKARTYDAMNVDFGSLSGSQNITLKIRAVGDNGKISEGEITFNIDLDDLPNFGTRVQQSVFSGDFVNATTHEERLLDAKIVDEFDNIVKSGTRPAFFKIQSLNSDFKVVIEDNSSTTTVWEDGIGLGEKGFSHFFGLNNFFTQADKYHYARDFAVNPEILHNPSLFSTSRLREASLLERNITVGDAKAVAEVEFSSDNPADFNDAVITVAGVSYTLKNSATLEKDEIDISTAANRAEIIDSIISKFSFNRKVSELLEFSRHGATIKISSKIAGEDGNNISFRMQGAAGAFFSGAADTGVLNLEGGSNKTIKQNIASSSGLVVTNGYKDVLKEYAALDKKPIKFKLLGTSLDLNVGNLKQLGEVVLRKISVSSSSINSMEKITSSSLEVTAEEYKQDYGFNADLTALKLQEIQQNASMIATTFSIYREVFREIISAFR
jgi:flagellar hook-associated protein FlgK